MPREIRTILIPSHQVGQPLKFNLPKDAKILGFGPHDTSVCMSYLADLSLDTEVIHLEFIANDVPVRDEWSHMATFYHPVYRQMTHIFQWIDPHKTVTTQP